MTAIMCSPVLYVCDGGRCKAEAMGTTARLPEGWRESGRTEVRVDGSNEIIDTWVGHLCPRCVPPESGDVKS